MRNKILKVFMFSILFSVFASVEVFAMEIFVVTPTGQEEILEVEPTEAIESVKKKIKDETGVLIVEQVLTYNGSVLLDNRTLSDYNIQREARINLKIQHNFNSELLWDLDLHWKKCGNVDCDEIIGEESHVYSDDFSSNESYHWKETVCIHSILKYEEEHVAGEWMVVKKATVEEEGERVQQCRICNYILQREIVERLSLEDAWEKEEPLENPNKPEESSKVTHNPKTGDITSVAMFGILIMFSLLAMFCHKKIGRND